MSTQSIIAVLRQRHAGPSTCEPNSCDACKAMEVLDQAREALQSLQERNSKGQYDQAGFANTIREGLGEHSTMNIGDKYTDINGRVRIVTDVGDGIVGYRLSGSTVQHQTVAEFHAQTVAKHVHEETSPEVASIAGRLLQDPNTPPEVRSVAASALTQAEDITKPDAVIPAPKGYGAFGKKRR